MEITQATYDNLLKLKDNDDIFEKTMELLEFFRKKYKDISNLNDEKIFKTEVKVIFQLLHHVFSSEDELEDLDEEDLEKFQKLVGHLRTVINSIDDYDLKQPNESTTSSLNYVLEYFNEKNKEMNELNETLSKTNDKLEELQNMLEDKNKLDDICKVLKEDVTDENREYLQESEKWCKLRLKKYDKDLVMQVIENKHSPNPVNYSSQISTVSEIEDKKKLNDLLNIDLTLTLILTIEGKLKT